ncbi:MAG: hypothetical protein U0T69_03080 [Chitinophagales bacterium]
MRYFFIINILLFSAASSFSQNYNIEAYTFHQSIVEAQQNIGKEVFEFNERATDLNLKILKFELQKSIDFINNLKVYNNETEYYNATKKLFALYKDISENEYPQLLKIIEDPDLDFKDFKVKKQKIFDSMKAKTAAVYPEFNAAQEKFCKKYGIKLE